MPSCACFLFHCEFDFEKVNRSVIVCGFTYRFEETCKQNAAGSVSFRLLLLDSRSSVSIKQTRVNVVKFKNLN